MAAIDALTKALREVDIKNGTIEALGNLLKEEKAKLKLLKEEFKKQKAKVAAEKKVAAAKLKEQKKKESEAKKAAAAKKKEQKKDKTKKGKKKKKVLKDVKFKRPRGGTPKSKVSGEKMVWDYENGGWKEPLLNKYGENIEEWFSDA